MIYGLKYLGNKICRTYLVEFLYRDSEYNLSKIQKIISDLIILVLDFYRLSPKYLDVYYSIYKK